MWQVPGARYHATRLQSRHGGLQLEVAWGGPALALEEVSSVLCTPSQSRGGEPRGPCLRVCACECVQGEVQWDPKGVWKPSVCEVLIFWFVNPSRCLTTSRS